VTTVIREADLVASIADALQFIACYHPVDFIRHMKAAYEAEESPAARDAIAQILVNSRMCALGRRPICQDTGMVSVSMEVGTDVKFDTGRSLLEVVNDGVRRAYNHDRNPLRASMVADPLFARKNTGDNTPAMLSFDLVPGDKVKVKVAAKGGGSENKTKFAVLNPSDSVVDWVLRMVEQMGAGWCPPGILGIGAGGSSDKAMYLAKQALYDPLDMLDLLKRGPQNKEEELRIELYEKVNALGIGAQGLGGLKTVLDVKIKTYPSHAAGKPIALIPNCAATRLVRFTLDGSGPAEFTPPDLSEWPEIVLDKAASHARKVNLDTLKKEDMKEWKPGDTLLLSGKLLTGRDAAHKRMVDMLAKGEKLPVDLKGRVIYYVGPVDPAEGEVVGPAGPTTATRMDKFTDTILEKTGLIAMVGKAERGPAAIESIKRHEATYLIAVGGAAFLVSKAIKKARVLAFEDLGMEAIYEFEVEDMPVTVAVDTQGNSVHQSGPKAWKRLAAE
jgi:fumarate hydratase class I